jgi:PKD repeat protein
MITAAFQESSDVVQTGQSVTLTSTTSGVSTYQWSFGNGTSANGATTSVSYTQAGVYEVSLVVASPSGCSSTKTESITVNTTTTGLNNLSGTGSLRIWSHDDKVYVDFTGVTMVNSLVTIYNILGQQIVSENVISGNLIFQQKIDTFDAEYLIVMVRNDDKIVTKKVLITNGK